MVWLRSGKLLITSFLNSLKSLGSPIYQDMPFINTPIVWNYFSKFYYGKNQNIYKNIMEMIWLLILIHQILLKKYFWINKDKNFDFNL